METPNISAQSVNSFVEKDVSRLDSKAEYVTTALPKVS